MLIAACSDGDPRPPPESEAGRPGLAVTPGAPLVVLGWFGPPQEHSSRERFAEMRDAGFTHSMNNLPYSDNEAMARALEEAEAAGIRIFVNTPELFSDTRATVERFRDHPANGGYHVTDEPLASQFPHFGRICQDITAADPVHPCYINLLPIFAGTGEGAREYRESYIEPFVAQVPTQILSFDHYPFRAGGEFSANFFSNLEIISEEAKEAGKPFWAFARSLTRLPPFPTTSMEKLKVQMFSNLAYGAKGLEYFTYWSPSPDSPEAPIDPVGNRTVVFPMVEAVNARIHELESYVSGTATVSVGHLGESIPPGTRPFAASAPVRSVELESGQGLIAEMEQGARRQLFVHNTGIGAPLELLVTVDPVERAFFRIDPGEEPTLVTAGEFSWSIPPAEVAILAWTD